MADLQGKRILFLTSNEGVEQSELTGPWDAVAEAGGQPFLAATSADKVLAFEHTDKADTFEIDGTTSEVDAGDFAGLVLPGGVVNADQLRTDKAAVKVVNDFFEMGRPVAAICHGAWAIVEAGQARGRTMTSWPSLQTDILNAGGHWVDEEVKVCTGGPNVLVTSRQPPDIPAFNKALLAAFAEQG
jgi:protease I